MEDITRYNLQYFDEPLEVFDTPTRLYYQEWYQKENNADKLRDAMSFQGQIIPQNWRTVIQRQPELSEPVETLITMTKEVFIDALLNQYNSRRLCMSNDEIWSGRFFNVITPAYMKAIQMIGLNGIISLIELYDDLTKSEGTFQNQNGGGSTTEVSGNSTGNGTTTSNNTTDAEYEQTSWDETRTANSNLPQSSNQGDNLLTDWTRKSGLQEQLSKSGDNNAHSVSIGSGTTAQENENHSISTTTNNGTGGGTNTNTSITNNKQLAYELPNLYNFIVQKIEPLTLFLASVNSLFAWTL